ncbi:hypothetical protein [Streptococcus loxodontisalivarius]|uniref:Uncharacterized protein n=1 Tax=Streptococcus loxodontisalivarius TaxID=1349415 RepID=A0ABS2PSD9_9STRE|nr:hypothetical protein [Streptococcus loxodontisalivarius]MBM7642465.1 hypothetical protein [Streptococcus loxodontisalivarius]
MDIKDFMASKCAYIYEMFATIPRLDIQGLRLELKVANEIGLIYNCQFLASEDPYSNDVILECRIMFENDLQRISIDCSQLPTMQSVDDYLIYFDQFELLEKQLNFEYAINH